MFVSSIVSIIHHLSLRNLNNELWLFSLYASYFLLIFKLHLFSLTKMYFKSMVVYVDVCPHVHTKGVRSVAVVMERNLNMRLLKIHNL